MGSPFQSQLEELEALREVKAGAEQEEGRRAPPSREDNHQDREVHSESPRGDHGCLDCHVVCRPPAREDIEEDG